MIYNITFSRNDSNYGQRLQTYALQKFIKNNCNVDVTTIDPRPFSSDFPSFENECMNVKYINCNKNFFNNLSNNDYCVIFGGDQIWNSNCSGNSIKWFVGDYIPNDISKFSYSVSINGDHKIINDDKLLNSISKFKEISIREKNDSDELNKRFKELHLTPTSKYHIDPALLLTKEEWSSIMRKPNDQILQSFDFEYTICRTNEERVENGQKIYTSSANVHGQITKYDPREWIWMVANCRKLITTSFHGFVFGLIFNKQFSKTDWSDNYRVQNLINVLGIKLEDGIIQNYEDVMKKINNERTRSIEYLSRCLTQQNIQCSSATNIQVLVQLLKKFNIRHGIINPGTTHGAFVASILNDPFFKCYSVIDERSASYMAVGMSRELNEPVFIACTGATASRNYIPGATEAFYSNAKVLYITGDYGGEKGMNVPQQIDRSQIQKDIAKKSYIIDGDLQTCRRRVSEGLNYILKDEGGPVHFNLISNNWREFTHNIIQVEPIQYYDYKSQFPSIPKGSKLAILMEAHYDFTQQDIDKINEFCKKYNCVFLENPNTFVGEIDNRIRYYSIVKHGKKDILDIDIFIYVGGPYSEYSICGIKKGKLWKVGLDNGKLIDPFNNLDKSFDIGFIDFIDRYNQIKDDYDISFFDKLNSIVENDYQITYEKDIPFSNIWVAKKFSEIIPKNSIVYMSGANTYKSWCCWKCNYNVKYIKNTGGFGIDGVMSTLIGSSLVNDKLNFCFIGDSAFFYDLNSLGIHYIKPNLRVCIINNGGCVEFNTPYHFCSQFESHDWHAEIMMAKSHYGNKSKTLVKHYAEDLGFKYMSACNKQEFEIVYKKFIDQTSDKPIVFECFIDDKDDIEALKSI